MKHFSSIKAGEIYIAQIYSAPYGGKRLVIVIGTASGLISVVPVRTSKMHRSNKNTLIVPKTESAVGRKISVDCGTIITLRKNALLQQIGLMTDENIEKMRRKIS